MKNLLFGFVLITILASCSSDVKFNNPAFQAEKQGTLWNASNYKATLASNGYVTIIGFKDFETVTLRTNTIAPHTSTFGLTGVNFAEYDNRAVGFIGNYSTGYNGANGQITITNYSEGTVSGNFKFNAVNTNPDLLTPDKINFKNGVFYKIPVSVAQ